MKLKINEYYKMRSGWTVHIIKKQGNMYIDADGHKYSNTGKSNIDKSCDLVKLASKIEQNKTKIALKLVKELVKLMKEYYD